MKNCCAMLDSTNIKSHFHKYNENRDDTGKKKIIMQIFIKSEYTINMINLQNHFYAYNIFLVPQS